MSRADVEEPVFVGGLLASDSQASTNEQARALGHALASRTGVLKNQAQIAILTTAGVVGWMSRGSKVVIMASSSDGLTSMYWNSLGYNFSHKTPYDNIALTGPLGVIRCTSQMLELKPETNGYAGNIYWPAQFIGLATIPEDGVYSLSNFTGTAIVVY